MSPRGSLLRTPEAVRGIEHAACVQGGFRSFELMQRAGAAAFSALRAHWPEARRIALVCGSGNNGGDGYLVAAHALAEGLKPVLVQIGDPAARGDARQAWATVKTMGVPVTHDPVALAGEFDLIVDALFGIGLNRPLETPARTVVAAINRHGAPKFSLDIPSGLHAVTGAVLGDAVRASRTLTFIAHKPGLYTGAARAHTGLISLARLGVGDSAAETLPAFARLTGWEDWKGMLPARSPVAHKGDSGHVLVVGGGPGMAGAACLAAEAALRTGAGLVSVATGAAGAAAITGARPEVMAHAVDSGSDLRALCRRASVLALGPGLGQSPWARRLWGAADESGLPRVVDADALNLLAADPVRRADWVLTPHPGEAARLLRCETGEIGRDRYAAARELQARYGGTVVLKGAGSIIVGPGGQMLVASGGNPGMATGGMGDALTGVIAALIAQGMALEAAAAAGVALHAAAGDLAAGAAPRGLLASELVAGLRALVN